MITEYGRMWRRGEMTDTKYCLCCDEHVPFGIVERNQRNEVTCNYCGFTLDIQTLPDVHHAKVEGYVLVADDSKYTRKIIEELIRGKNFSSAVISFENGLELLTMYSKFLSEKKTVDVIILDLNMPVMNGLTAARAIRTIEMQNRVPKVPIMFFSAEKGTEDFRMEMESLDPAYYINKGSDPDPDKLALRVEYLLGYLVEKFMQ
jgi:CheY-like chemotaxis protein